eukprot:2819501-Amphidinium_carterae.2
MQGLQHLFDIALVWQRSKLRGGAKQQAVGFLCGTKHTTEGHRLRQDVYAAKELSDTWPHRDTDKLFGPVRQVLQRYPSEGRSLRFYLDPCRRLLWPIPILRLPVVLVHKHGFAKYSFRALPLHASMMRPL